MNRPTKLIFAICTTVIAGLVLSPATLAQSSFEIKAEQEEESFNKNPALGGYYKSKANQELEFEWGLEESRITETRTTESEEYSGYTTWSNCAFEGTAYPALYRDYGYRKIWRIYYTGTYTYVTSTGIDFTGSWSSYFYAVDFTDPGITDSLSYYGVCADWTGVYAFVDVE